MVFYGLSGAGTEDICGPWRPKPLYMFYTNRLGQELAFIIWQWWAN